MYYISASIREDIDSISLYDKLKPYKMNVTDLISITLVYGNVSNKNLVKVLKVLEDYNVTKISLNRIRS